MRVDVTQPPVQLDKILSAWQNLDIIEVDLDGAGYLLPFGAHGGEILVNKNHSSERKQFTVAHELGHWILGLICQKRTGEFRQPEGVPKATIEKWCDTFATNLLMPAGLVRSCLPARDHPQLIDAILRASDKFMVSKEAFFIRVWEVEQIQVAILRLQPIPSIERAYGDCDCNKALAKLLDTDDVHVKLQISSPMVWFTLRCTAGRVWVSGRRLDGGRMALALAWPRGT